MIVEFLLFAGVLIGIKINIIKSAFQLEEIRKMSPSTYKTAVARVNAKPVAATNAPDTAASVATSAVESSNEVVSRLNNLPR